MPVLISYHADDGSDHRRLQETLECIKVNLPDDGIYRPIWTVATIIAAA